MSHKTTSENVQAKELKTFEKKKGRASEKTRPILFILNITINNYN